MTRGYAKVGSPRKWEISWLARLTLILSIGFSAVISAILIIGAANPLYPPHLQVMPSTGVNEFITNWFVLTTPSERFLPLTLEVEADMSTAERWGVWVGTGARFHSFYIRSDERFQADFPYWQSSTSIRPDVNRIYIYIAANGWQDPFVSSFYVPEPYQVTMRINNDIVWTGTIPSGLNSWGVIGSDNVDWKAIKIYTSG